MTPNLDAARMALDAFLQNCPCDARLVALHDTDADGVAAGVVWQRGMEWLGRAAVRVLPGRERNAWTDANRAVLADQRPDRLFVLDLGSQSEPILPGVPTCFIDHHKPGGVPQEDTLISAYEMVADPQHVAAGVRTSLAACGHCRHGLGGRCWHGQRLGGARAV